MKKKMLATTLLTGLLAACSGNSASVTGVWIEPITPFFSLARKAFSPRGGALAARRRDRRRL